MLAVGKDKREGTLSRDGETGLASLLATKEKVTPMEGISKGDKGAINLLYHNLTVM